MEYLLSKGADVNGAMRPGSNNQDFPRRGTGPLLLAVENGHYDLAAALLDAGANPNDTRTGFSILHALTWIRRPDIGEGAAGDPAPQGSGRRNSLQFARELIKRGSSVNFQLDRGRKAGGARVSEIGATPLFMAADRADLNYMKLLVELGADPFLPNNEDTTPLMVAAGLGQVPAETRVTPEESLAAVEFALSLGANVNRLNAIGRAALHGAAHIRSDEIVQVLVDHGAAVNATDERGITPLMIAEGGGHILLPGLGGGSTADLLRSLGGNETRPEDFIDSYREGPIR